MQMSRLRQGDPTVANGAELDIIAAVVIGGGSLSGGEGSILGSMIGALIMAFLRNGCQQMGWPNYIQEIIIGVIIVLAVALDRAARTVGRTCRRGSPSFTVERLTCTTLDAFNSRCSCSPSRHAAAVATRKEASAANKRLTIAVIPKGTTHEFWSGSTPARCRRAGARRGRRLDQHHLEGPAARGRSRAAGPGRRGLHEPGRRRHRARAARQPRARAPRRGGEDAPACRR